MVENEKKKKKERNVAKDKTRKVKKRRNDPVSLLPVDKHVLLPAPFAACNPMFPQFFRFSVSLMIKRSTIKLSACVSSLPRGVLSTDLHRRENQQNCRSCAGYVVLKGLKF